jgi:hypothetical protein
VKVGLRDFTLSMRMAGPEAAMRPRFAVIRPLPPILFGGGVPDGVARGEPARGFHFQRPGGVVVPAPVLVDAGSAVGRLRRGPQPSIVPERFGRLGDRGVILYGAGLAKVAVSHQRAAAARVSLDRR